MITAADSFDSSSLVRTPQLGQIAIWRNVNGLYAASKVVTFTDDTCDDATNKVTFEYVLLAGGGADFSTTRRS